LTEPFDRKALSFFFEKRIMNKQNCLYEEHDFASEEVIPYARKAIRQKKLADEEWNVSYSAESKRYNKRARRSQMEDRLTTKYLNQTSNWTCGDYDF